MDVNIAALIAGIVALVGVGAHGGVGGVWLAAQMRATPMPTTELSKQLFGNRDVAWAVIHIAWHAVTAFFLISAASLLLTAFGELASADLLRFTAVVYAAFLVLGLAYFEKTPGAMLRPIPLAFAAGMSSAGALAWIASNSV